LGLAGLCALLLAASPAHALLPIDTDGPDYVESSETVPKGHFQYEVDATAVDDRRPATPGTTLSTPTLLKYGWTDNLELRIAPEGYERQDGVSGVGETAFGLKWHTQGKDEASGMPAVSWLLHIDAPSGSSEFKGNGLRPSLRTVYTWDLPYDLSLGIMPGVKYDTTADAHRFVSGSFGIVLNKHFSERFRAFVEFGAPQIAPGRDGGVLADWDIGAAYMVTNDFQLGVRAGVAANRNTPSSYVLFEVAQRF
jgi:hypothetical protein